MIIFGSTDPGAIEYFKTIYKELKKKVFFIANKKNINYLKKNKLPFITRWKIKSKIHLAITGSSLGDTLDKEIIVWCKKNDIYTISIIEHWTNFSSRFYYKNKKIYPNQIFVNDNIAREHCLKSKYNQNLIYVAGNPLLEKFYYKYKKQKSDKKIKSNRKKILFLSQPTDDHLPEEQRVKISLEKKVVFILIDILPKNYFLTIKLHPREKKEKFNDLKFLKTPINIIRDKSIKKIAQEYGTIIAISTFLLFELSFLRDNLISFNPKNNNFIGERLGIVKNVSSSKVLKDIIIGKKHIKNDINKFKVKFIGSKKKIISSINNLINE